MIPTRETLRAEYDSVIEEIERSRGTSQLTNEFYTQVGLSVFEAGYSALERAARAAGPLALPPRLHVVSAPMGAGKTTFTYALITMMVRREESAHDLPYGCVYLVEQREKADGVYKALSALLPGKVAIWTQDHDVNPSAEPKVQNPAARHDVDELKHYPVIVVTHAFFKGSRGHKARYVSRNSTRQLRALAVVDEQPKDVRVHDVTLTDVSAVLDRVREDAGGKIVATKLQTLVTFMALKSPGGSLEKPTDDPEQWQAVSRELEWFTTAEAREYVAKHKAAIPRLEDVCGYATALANGYAFITRYDDKTPHFVGYANTLIPMPGMMLLDATADIDGLTQLCPWRKHVEVPQASYANLTIIHAGSCTKVKLSKYLTTEANCRTYVRWMETVVKRQMDLGQRALVVCKKVLLDHGYVPKTDHSETAADEKRYSWNVDGRLVGSTSWGGFGIGSNTWKDADVVFLFDEFYKPRRATIAEVHGLMDRKATEGPLGAMHTANSKSQQIDALEEGNLLRNLKQMGLRGKGRFFDEHGVCGKQKLVCTGSDRSRMRLLANLKHIFPDAQFVPTISDDDGSKRKRADAFIAVISQPDLPDEISTRRIGEQVGAPWRQWSQTVLKLPEVQEAMKNLGWRYESVRGRGGGRLVRDSAQAVFVVDHSVPALTA